MLNENTLLYIKKLQSLINYAYIPIQQRKVEKKNTQNNIIWLSINTFCINYTLRWYSQCLSKLEIQGKRLFFHKVCVLSQREFHEGRARIIYVTEVTLTLVAGSTCFIPFLLGTFRHS